MTEYDAGSARATWEIDFGPARREIAAYRQELLALQQAQQQAQQARGTQTVVPRSEAPNARVVGSGSGVDAQSQRAAVAAAKLAAEQSKAALAAQRLATEEQRTAAQLANAERAETQAAAAALRYSQQQEKANRAASGGRSGFSQLAETARGLQATLGAVGIGVGVAALVQGTRDAALYATSLRQTEGVLRQLAGSQDRYNTLTRIAAENQRLFGGTLAQNYAPLTGVLALSNQTGASLERLNQVSQLLLAKAPGKSAGDAFFGLGEFLSGTGAEAALSLADQFNLNKKAIAELAKEGVSAEDRLRGLTRLLAEQGVTAATLQARLTDQSQAYNRLGAAGEQAYIRLGEAANQAGVPLANFVADGLEGLNVLLKFNAEIDKTSSRLIAGSASYDDYRARVQAANAELPPFVSQITLLGPAAYAAQRALLAQGGALTSATVDAQKLAGTSNVVAFALDTMAGEYRKIHDATTPTAEAQAALGAEMLRLAGTSEANRLTIDALANAYQVNQINAAQLQQSVTAMATAQQATASATAEANREAERNAGLMARSGDATAAAAAASNKDAQAKIEQAAQTAVAAARHDQLQAALDRAAASSGDAAKLAAQLAGVYEGTQAPALERIIMLLREKNALEADPTTAQGYGGAAPGDVARAQAAAQQSQYRRQLQDDITRATGSTAQQLALVERQLRAALPYSEEARRLEVEKARLLKQQADERERAALKGAKADAKDTKAAAKAYEAEYEAARDAAQKVEDLQRQHYETLRRLAEDYQLSQSRSQEDYERARQRLLAEGKIKEAQLLEEDFKIKQRRAAEDAAVAARREQEQAQQQIAEAQAKAAQDARDRAVQRQLNGQALPGDAAAAAQERAATAQARAAVPAAGAAAAQAQAAQAQAVLAATAQQAPRQIQLQVQIAPTAVNLDSGQIVTIIWPTISQLVDAELAGGVQTLALTAAPGQGQGSGVGGPTP